MVVIRVERCIFAIANRKNWLEDAGKMHGYKYPNKK